MSDKDKDATPAASVEPAGATSATRCLRSRDKAQFSSFVKAMEDPDKTPELVTTASNKRAPEKRKAVETIITTKSTPKRKKLFASNQTEEYQDVYCWECHKQSVESCLDCSTCCRTFHSKCIPNAAAQQHDSSAAAADDWTCPVCIQIMKAECADTRSWSMQLLTQEKFATLLMFALNRMKHADSKPFENPVSKSELSDYYDVVFHPMDLSTLEKNIKKRQYASTVAFLEDAKWILHNCIIYNGSTSKFVTDAKLIIKICKHEMTEIEICPDCYYTSNFKKDSSFIEPCTFPHCIIWAKLKGFPYWPAKALRISGSSNVDVRFFGAHDRSWIPLAQCYLISEESPITMKATKKYGMEVALQELQQHIECIREKFGCFTYAPARTEFKPEHLYTCDILFGSDIQSKVPDLGNGSDRRARNHSGFGAEESCDAEGLMNDCASSTGRPDDSVSDTISNDGNPGDRTGTPVQLSKSASKELEKDVVSSSYSRLPQRMSGGGSASHRRSSSKSAGGESSAQNGKDAPSTEQLAIVTEETPPGVFSLLDQSLEEGLKDISDEMTSPEMGNESSCGLSRKVLGRVPSSDTNIVDDLEARLAGDLSAGTDASALIDRSDNEDSLGSFQQSSDVEIVSSSGNVNSDAQEKITDSSAKSQAAFPKKRSLNSCLQKLVQSQKTDAVVSPVIVSTSSPSQLPERQQQQLQQPLLQARPNSNISASAATASTLMQQQQQLRIVNATGGRREEVVKTYVPPAALSTAASSADTGIDQSPQNHAEILKRYSAKMSNAVMSVMDEMLSELGPTFGADGSSSNSSSMVASLQAANSAVTLENKTLRDDMNRLRWLQKQAISELDHNTKLALREMQEQNEQESRRALEELRRRAEEEKLRLVGETKLKQWCANCQKEAMFYCCWNTSYCDYQCQKIHWPKHQETCAQIRLNNESNAMASQQQPQHPQQQTASAYLPQHAPVVGGYANAAHQSASAVAQQLPPQVQYVATVPVYPQNAPQRPGNVYPSMQPRPPGPMGNASQVTVLGQLGGRRR